MRVAMHELKIGLSRYVAQARAGAVIEITSHEKPVARIVGIPAPARGGSRGVDCLVATGAAQWNGSKPKTFEPVRLPSHGTTLSEMVIEDRR
jgi:prevent-host-death family protein